MCVESYYVISCLLHVVDFRIAICAFLIAFCILFHAFNICLSCWVWFWFTCVIMLQVHSKCCNVKSVSTTNRLFRAQRWHVQYWVIWTFWCQLLVLTKPFQRRNVTWWTYNAFVQLNAICISNAFIIPKIFVSYDFCYK